MNKRAKTYARPLADLVRRTLADTFARQGFASTELVTHWDDIVSAEIAAHCEPIRLQWPRGGHVDAPEPATLVLRVEGPIAIEIQHLAPVILERVNRFFGWRAGGGLLLRQAPPVPRGRPTRKQRHALPPRSISPTRSCAARSPA